MSHNGGSRDAIAKLAAHVPPQSPLVEMSNSVHFSEIQATAPDLSQLHDDYDHWRRAIEADPSSTLEHVQAWDTCRREVSTWRALVELRFNQDTSNPHHLREQELSDRIRPQLLDLDTGLKRVLLTSAPRQVVEAEYGTYVTRLWEVELSTFDPVISDDLVEEASLKTSYNQCLAAAEFDFQGESHNHSSITQFQEHPDRNVRHAAASLQWNWFHEHRQELDELFDGLVNKRHAMATKLGFDNFVQLGYRRMSRIDYNEADVAQFRDNVQQCVVPLGQQLMAQQAMRLGLDHDDFRQWDEAIHDAVGNPRPQGDHDDLLKQAQAMFDEIGYGLDDFFRLMTSADLLDLKNRPHKAGGGFCTSFDRVGLPFIFANFNGTKGDVEVFTHEMGHAFQVYQSRHHALAEFLLPTYDACEIHSMGLEFLTYPQMERFFGDDAERFRQIHLEQSLLFLPYGVTVDHFQHHVYEHPTASPQDRFTMWQQLERHYLPWRNWGDLPHGRDGGRWQLQRHIYLDPFYYIDYTLAQTCALQLWAQAEKDRDVTMQRYVTLCGRGGEAPFRTLVEQSGLTSPFEAGCLDQVTRQAEAVLRD